MDSWKEVSAQEAAALEAVWAVPFSEIVTWKHKHKSGFRMVKGDQRRQAL
jgi:hypothetical protein